MSNIHAETCDLLEQRCDELAEALVQREFKRHPELVIRCGETGREKSLQDARYHLLYLSEAVGRKSPLLFEDYIAWTRDFLTARNALVEDFAIYLGVLKGVLSDQLPPPCANLANDYITQGARQLSEANGLDESFIDVSQPLSSLTTRYLGALLAFDRRTATRLILEGVSSGIDVRDIYSYVFQSAQYEIGRLWQTNQISVAQEHFCTAATQLVMSQLYPQIFSTEPVHGALVATCVAGDLHEIGLRMVADFLQLDGWDTYYLGANVPNKDVLKTLVETGANILAISATMTFHIGAVEALITQLRDSSIGNQVRVLVGGYPFRLDSQLWKSVGADVYGRDAAETVELVEQFKAR